MTTSIKYNKVIINQNRQGMSPQNINTPNKCNTYIENNFIYVKSVEYRFSDSNNNNNNN